MARVHEGAHETCCVRRVGGGSDEVRSAEVRHPLAYCQQAVWRDVGRWEEGLGNWYGTAPKNVDRSCQF